MTVLLLIARIMSLAAFLVLIARSQRQALNSTRHEDDYASSEPIHSLGGAALIALGSAAMLIGFFQGTLFGHLPWILIECTLIAMGLTSWFVFIEERFTPLFNQYALYVHQSLRFLRESIGQTLRTRDLSSQAVMLKSKFLKIGSDFARGSHDASEPRKRQVAAACASCGSTDGLQIQWKKAELSDVSSAFTILALCVGAGLLIDIFSSQHRALAAVGFFVRGGDNIGSTLGYTIFSLLVGVIAAYVGCQRRDYMIQYALCDKHNDGQSPYPVVLVFRRQVFLEFGNEMVKSKIVHANERNSAEIPVPVALLANQSPCPTHSRSSLLPSNQDRAQEPHVAPPRQRGDDSHRQTTPEVDESLLVPCCVSSPCQIENVVKLKDFEINLPKPRRLLGMQIAPSTPATVVPLEFTADSNHLIAITSLKTGRNCRVLDVQKRQVLHEREILGMVGMGQACIDAEAGKAVFVKDTRERWYRVIKELVTLDAVNGELETVQRIRSFEKLVHSATAGPSEEFYGYIGRLTGIPSTALLGGGIRLHGDGRLISFNALDEVLVVAMSGTLARLIQPAVVDKSRTFGDSRQGNFFVSRSGNSVAYTARGRFYVTNTASGMVAEYNAGDNRGRSPANYVQFSPDDSYAFVVEGDSVVFWDLKRALIVWEQASMAKAWNVKIPDLRPQDSERLFTFSFDMRYFLVNCLDGAMLIKNEFLGGPLVVTKLSSRSRVTSSAFSRDMRYAAIGDSEGTVTLWELVRVKA